LYLLLPLQKMTAKGLSGNALKVIFNATSIAWPLLWGLILLKTWDTESLARWKQVAVTIVACLL